MLNKKNYRTKTYLHFDHRVNITNAESYVTDPLKIARHSFLPLIHYVQSFEKKVDKKNIKYNNRPVKIKKRDIMYAGHWDNHIYKYYAEMLNNKFYNPFCIDENLNECITAYRNNKPNESNIEFAAEIINQIVEFKEAFILVGDFTHYFDKINHDILKKNLMRVINVNRLSEDWFNVYRSITKYGYYEKDFIEAKCGTKEFLKSKGQFSYFKQVKDFRAFQKENKIKYNKNGYGIPQGTAISAVFANVYAIDFDMNMKAIADWAGGMYRRYSDDFILVIPKKTNSLESFQRIEKKVIALAETNKICLQKDKTKIYLYENQKVINLVNKKFDHLDYLGFLFDGKSVRMRGKSPYKFYRKAKHLIEIAQVKKNKKDLKKLPYRKKIYLLYTDLGTKKKKMNNFIDYAKKAQMSFDNLSPKTDNLMMQQIKNRKKKIEKMLGVKIHTKV